MSIKYIVSLKAVEEGYVTKVRWEKLDTKDAEGNDQYGNIERQKWESVTTELLTRVTVAPVQPKAINRAIDKAEKDYYLA